MKYTVNAKKVVAEWRKSFNQCVNIDQAVFVSTDALAVVQDLFPDYVCGVSVRDEVVFTVERGNDVFHFRLDCFFALVMLSEISKEVPSLKMNQHDYANLLDAINDSFKRWEGMPAEKIACEFIMAKALQTHCMSAMRAKGVSA